MARPSLLSEPLVDDRDVDRGLVADYEFVEPGGHGSMLFELVDATLDRVAVAVEHRIECRWPSPGRTAAPPVRGLIGRYRDRRRDPMAT